MPSIALAKDDLLEGVKEHQSDIKVGVNFILFNLHGTSLSLIALLLFQFSSLNVFANDSV